MSKTPGVFQHAADGKWRIGEDEQYYVAGKTHAVATFADGTHLRILDRKNGKVRLAVVHRECRPMIITIESVNDVGDWQSLSLEDLEAAYARLCTLERGHELYGKTAKDYGEERLKIDLDAIELEMERRKEPGEGQ